MILLIGLNIFKNKEPKISYTIGTLAQELFRENILFEILDLDLTQSSIGYELDYIISSLSAYNLKKFEFIGISVFSWAEFIINDLIHYLKRINPKLRIILGGPQISYSTDYQLKTYYPQADIFVKGYGEKTLVKILRKYSENKIYYSDTSYYDIESPYNNVINVINEQEMIRIETKRNCPFRCAFCAHFAEKRKRKVTEFTAERVLKDLELIKKYKVKKVNVLDPVFNVGKNYPRILEIIKQKQIKSLFAFQTRFELIDPEKLYLFKDINCKLEFGLQTINPEEERNIDRPNNIEKVEFIMSLLNSENIPYEVSIIYGLPGQTFNSFLKTIEFLEKNGCYDIRMFPLGLLRGTKLDLLSDYYKFKTIKLSRFDSPVVISSYSFDYAEWEKMHLLAQNYKNKKSKNLQLCQKSLL